MRTVERRRGYFVVKHDAEVVNVPLTCPMCTQVMSTLDDVTMFRKFGCCAWCERMWISGRDSAWLQGWRPEQSTVSETLLGLGITKRRDI